MLNRPTVLLIVLDAMGIPTWGNLIRRHGHNVNLPNLAAMGLGDLLDENAAKLVVTRSRDANTYATALRQASTSTDSLICHQEAMGPITTKKYTPFSRWPATRVLASAKSSH